MPRSRTRSKDKTLKGSVDTSLGTESEADAEGRFRAEARRQSQLIADSEDEAEVTRWIRAAGTFLGGE